MRIYYKKEELVQLYERLVEKAQLFCKRGNFNKALTCVSSAADFQYHLNSFYSDNRLDDIIKRISLFLHKPDDNYLPNQDVVFFYDSFCLDNRGLTQQYLDALVDCRKYKIVYVLEHPINEKGRDTIKYCSDNNISVKALPDGSWQNKEQVLYNLIQAYRPCAALFHLTPDTIIPFLSFYTFPGITKYQLNLTDHAFWLGGPDFFDYSYEFRPYGVSVSKQKRGYELGQLILNPYYPWNSGEPFKGFPDAVYNKTVIFSGGSLYKIEGDNGKYYDMVRTIMSENPGAVFLYAGGGNLTKLRSFIADNNLENRMFLLGDRSDINAVFENCDIYLNTYPFGGGLMVQYAAINGKPILMYKCKDLEDVICTKNKGTVSIGNLPDLYKEAHRLITDVEYRKERGDFFKNLIADQNDFRKRFNDTFLKTVEPMCCEDISIDYNAFCDGYVEKLNKNVFGFWELTFIKTRVVSAKVVINSILNIGKIIKCLPRYIFNHLRLKFKNSKADK